MLFNWLSSLAQVTFDQVKVPDSLLRAHVYLLASDSLQGRETGTTGHIKAAAYCARSLRAAHLYAPFLTDSIRSSFYQTYQYTVDNVTRFGPSNRSIGAQRYSDMYRRAELLPSSASRHDSQRSLKGINVGGLILGTDLKRDIIIVSAHFDHIGLSNRGLFHGADDNASGTAAVLGVAALFDSLSQAGIKSRRSVLFILFSGEESGMLGSTYFVEKPPVPHERILCDLNADMVGRIDRFHRKSPDYCYLITNSRGVELVQTARQVNAKTVGLAINKGGYDTQSDPEQFFLRSDQYSFAEKNIPSLFFTSGTHEDYHQVTDTADKIRYDVLQKRATLLFHTAWALANPEP